MSAATSRAAIDILVYLIEQAFDGDPSHSLLANLHDLREEDWTAMPEGSGRSIADILEHVGWSKWMYENYAFGSTSMRGDQPPLIPEGGARSRPYRELLTWLTEGHRRWLASIRALTDDSELDSERLTNWGEQLPTRGYHPDHDRSRLLSRGRDQSLARPFAIHGPLAVRLSTFPRYGILSLMNPITSILEHHPVLVIDGALATELERRGCDLKDDLWSAKILLEQPEIIKQVHLDYFRAGADCVITASYQATIDGFAKRGLNKNEAIHLIQKSVKLAKEARDEFWAEEVNHTGRSKPFVAASVGPYGAFLADGSEYRGNYGLSEKELIDFHRPRMKALIDAGADLLACETIPALNEAQAIAKLLTEFPDISAWISFSGRDEKHVSEGQNFSECVWQLRDHPQVVAIGINCTSPNYVPSLIREARKTTEKPILVYPNSGETYNAEKNDWNGDPVLDSFGEQAREWYEAGARLIGGCCRTTPEDIRVIASWARNIE